jgi:hypothetical protein
MAKAPFATLLSIVCAATAGSYAASTEAPPQHTYCNPLSIPDYPLGRVARTVLNGTPENKGPLPWKEQFRELADPTALWLDGKWILYPSVDMAWVSADGGATWEHHPLNIRDVGYAPTVVKHRGRFLLLASGSELYSSDSPLGPFQPIGRLPLPQKIGDAVVPELIDPMLFSDDDGRLYLYWGCTPTNGIWVVELDATHPTQLVSEPVKAFGFDPVRHPWEAVGEWNQNRQKGWIEGSWMLKHNGTYYLTYSAAGTANRTYAMGCYTAKSPLGPFTPQHRNPIFRTLDGLITGTAHGCIVPGPDDALWVFYTLRAGVAHGFERRLGLDRAAIDEHGELYVPGATSLPQWLPGQRPAEAGNDTGWIPLNGGANTIGSSQASNLPGRLAVDNELRTWWQPAPEDTEPQLTSDLAPGTIHAVRLIWRDIGMNTLKGVLPGPFRYRVELQSPNGDWSSILDRTQSTEDLLIDYRETPAFSGATKARLVITGWPKGITPGVAEFTVFGEPSR